MAVKKSTESSESLNTQGQPDSGDAAGTSTARGFDQNRVSRISDLEVGQSESLSMRLDFDTATRATFTKTLKNLTNTVNSAAIRAGRRTGNTYVVESGSFRTKSGDMIISVVATRMA